MSLIGRWAQRAWRLLQGAAKAVMAAPDLLASVAATLLSQPLVRVVGFQDDFASPIEPSLFPSPRYLLRAHAQSRWRTAPGWSGR